MQVVWKLSAYSRRIRELTGCLTVHNVLEQLRKRWKLEVQGTHRSPLKMIGRHIIQVLNRPNFTSDFMRRLCDVGPANNCAALAA